MGANITIYCLQNVTDYFVYERLCNDVMSLEGYSSIEPLGGFKDKGRDAIHVSKSNFTTIFAYSVREDWRAKLSEDSAKIRKYAHKCNKLIFLTTENFTTGQRDEAIRSIKNEYNWDLELYGLERLRILIEVQHPQIKTLRPQIFPPDLISFQVNKNNLSKYLWSYKA